MKLKVLKLISVKSTNDEAIKLINKNKINPTIIYSEKQTRGRGTMGKKWISKKGNIFATIYFCINNIKIKSNEFSILNPYLIKGILAKYSAQKIDIKWPNDLMIKQKKISGILQEIIEFKNKKYLIIGIGINSITSPFTKKFKSTSLSNFSNEIVDNKLIMTQIIKTYEKFISDISKYDFSYLKKMICKN
jgi:BirA family biotin operon repressor/biotin-[acetyl-CoA-carboxylase] ligase|tara:strand:- start:3830 stop:4399 length:570 start_codon:yes stop_codon:yes gene_type:complete